MCRLLQVFLLLLLVSPLARSGDDSQVEVVKSLPRVECTSDLLNAEISHYLSLRDKTDDVKYWNLVLRTSDNIYYTCAIMRQDDFIPHEGKAYLQYGNNIFVIEGKYEKSFFRKCRGQKKDIKMLSGGRWVLSKDEIPENEVSMGSTTAFFMIKFYGNKVYRMYGEYGL